MRWVLPQTPEEAVVALTSELGIHPLVARILVQRGFTRAKDASAFLAASLSDLPDPFLMKGMPQAVDRVAQAIAKGEKITLYGDYDVDGVCSTSLLNLFLTELGATVATYIPHRLEEGYGLNVQAIEKIAEDGTRLLITLDCGITSHSEVTRANQLGLEVVIVDHHSVPATMPPAIAVLNPHQPGCDYPTKPLCAGGVAFNLCMGLRKKLRDEGFFAQIREPNLRSYLDLVALATVADVVPLVGANRVLVRHGLVELGLGKRPGVRALKAVSGLGEEEPVTAGTVGFRLGPRINAAGRLHDASVGLKLLCASSAEVALSLARELDAANAERQALEQNILEEAMNQASLQPDAKGLVLHSKEWHAGVIGIVASRVVERFHRPTVMIAMKDGVGRGSARSIEAFHLFEALSDCAGHLTRFGGHKYAAGLSIDEESLTAFAAAFDQIARARLTEEDLIPRVKVDAVVKPQDLDETTAEALQTLAPFGNGNPEPVLAARRLVTLPKVLPNKKAGVAGHLKLTLEAAPRLDTIGFGLADKLALTEGPVDLAFALGIDEWNGRRRVQLKLKDLKSSF